MKLALLSDLHLEMHKDADQYAPDVQDTDLVILAGDIHLGFNGLDWASKRFNESVYVAGNHEFYHGDRAESLDKMNTDAPDNVHFLERNTFIKDGVCFIGATLWTDYRLDGQEPFAMLDCERGLNDHRLIMNDDEQWLPHHAQQDHFVSKRFILDELAKTKDDSSIRATVVVTHHMIAPEAIHQRFKNSPINPGFCSDLTDILHSDIAPDYWCFGHTHDAFVDKVGNTMVLCNPRGYPMENGGYEPLIFEV